MIAHKPHKQYLQRPKYNKMYTRKPICNYEAPSSYMLYGNIPKERQDGSNLTLKDIIYFLLRKYRYLLHSHPNFGNT